jgi:hypothetical protein
MATRILLKRGTGVPVGLVYGEVALDVDEKKIYAAKANGDVVEMSGGTINWDQIIGVPPELGGDDLIDIAALEKQVGINTGDIATIKADVTQLWIELGEADALATAALNKANENAGLIQENVAAIDAINSEIGAIESGLIFGGVYSPVSGQITNVDKYATDRGFSEGMTLQTTTTAEQQGIYFICSVAGTGITNEDVKPGDWLIANANAWTLVEYGYSTITIDMVNGLQAKLDQLDATDSDLDGRVVALETEIDAGTYVASPPAFKG